jgi:biopolymer transport protein ExbD
MQRIVPWRVADSSAPLSSRVGGLTTLVALTVAGVMPSMAAKVIVDNARTIAIEVRAVAPRIDTFGEIACSDPMSPRAILVRVSRAEVVVGEDRATPMRTTTLLALQQQLRALKDARPDRQHVVIRVDDGVSFDRVVAVIDVSLGLHMRAIDVDVSPGDSSAFDEKTWSRR